MRVKVTIECKHCQERFILRGRKRQNTTYTGFKQCVCSNHTDFHIEEEEIS